MKIQIIRSALTLLLIVAGVACKKMPVGYLDADHASFPKKEVQAYRRVADDNPHSTKQQYPAPWSSGRIQGVSGTNPVNYLLSDVKASDGGDAARFKEEEKKGTITVYGGTINVFPAAVKVLPNGRYTVSLKVYNEGHTKILTDICTFIIQEEE